jgi:DNA-binding Xre family transcriptional regulator
MKESVWAGTISKVLSIKLYRFVFETTCYLKTYSSKVLEVLLLYSQKREGRVLRLRVKEVAEAKGISMTKLSHRTEISYNTIKSLFRNPYRTVNTDTLVRIARVLEVPVTELIEEIPNEE